MTDVSLTPPESTPDAAPAPVAGPAPTSTVPAAPAPPAVNPALPADKRDEASAVATGILNPAEPSVPDGSAPVAPTKEGVDLATQAVDAGLATPAVDPVTGLPHRPTIATVDVSAIPKPGVPETPEEFQKPIDQLMDEGRAAGFFDEKGNVVRGGQLAGADAKNLEEWNNRKNELLDLYKERRSKLEWGEAAETFGHALSRLGAGLYGLRTGYNLSGLQFDATDWGKRYDQALDEYKLGLNDLEKQSTAKRETIAQLRAEYQNWRGGLRAAQEAKGQADLTTQGQRRQADDTYKQMVFGAQKFNAEEANKVNVNYTDWQIRDTIAQLKAAGKTSPADRELLTVAAKTFGSDAQQYTLQTRDYQDGLSELSAVSKMKSGKDKDAALAKAQAKLGAAMRPGELADALQKADGRSSFWSHGPARDDYADALYDELQKKGASALRPPPKYTDYLRSAGVKISPSDEHPPATDLVSMRDPKTGVIKGIPRANVEKAKAQGLEVAQ